MFGTKFRRLPLSLNSIVRQQTNIATNFKKDIHDGQTKKKTNGTTNNRCTPATEKTIRDKHLANINVTSFYSQTAIEQLATKVDYI
jgi:hypothetical protein